MSETVEIKGQAPAIQTEGNENAVGLNTRTVQELPVIDRNHQQLANLQPGVTPPDVRFTLNQDPARQREWNTNGQPYYTNHQYLEGTNNYERMRGTAVRVVPMEAIQQFNVAAANYPENRGFAAGSLSNVVSRPGTNGWHGSLFEFHSDNNLHARGPFDLTGSAPRLTYNQFGASVGGPIVRDRFFFFGSYEGSYNRGDVTTLTTVPTAAMAAGNFSGIAGLNLYNPATGTSAGLNRTSFANNTIPSASISPFARALLPYFPAPNQAGLSNNFSGNVPYSNDWQKFDARIDGHFSDTTSAFLRYGFSNDHATQNSVFGSSLGLGDANRLIGQNAVFDATHTFSATMVGDFRLGYNRYYMKQFPMGSQAPIGAALGISNAPANFLPTLQIAGLGTIGSAPPFTGVDNNFQGSASAAWHTSHHNIKFGIDVQHYQVNGFDNLYLGQSGFGAFGSAIYGPGATLQGTTSANLGTMNLYPNAFAAFLLGAPSATGNTFFTTTPTARDTWYAAWIGDTVQLARIFTLELGARYEVYSPLTPRHGGGAQIFNRFNNTVNSVFGDVNQNWDLNNIAPRIGLAIRVTPRTVIRTGYSINYFQVPIALSGYMPSMYGTYSGVNGGFTAVPGYTNATFPAFQANQTAPTVTAGSNTFAAPNGPLTAEAVTDVTTPYVQQFNFQVQQEFMRGMVLGIGYQGALGRKLPYTYEGNQGLPGTGLAGLPLGSTGRTASTPIYASGLTSNYNALQINLTKRMGHGFQFQGAYTYGKALGYTSETGQLYNPFNLRANYGPADYDRQHMLTIAHVWDLPFGTGTNHMNHGIVGQILGNWAINGEFIWATGTPYTVMANPIFYGGPNGTVLANIVGPVNNGGTSLNSSAFAVPSVGSFGTAARNGLRGPDLETYNFSLFKTFAFHDHYKFELRGEAYNLTNSPVFLNPQANLNAAGFGQSTQLASGFGSLGRQVNVAIRVLF